MQAFETETWEELRTTETETWEELRTTDHRHPPWTKFQMELGKFEKPVMDGSAVAR